MHFSANPDRPAASCVICAKQLPDRDHACPYCGEGPFLDESPVDDDDDDWLNASSTSDATASDPVLDAMMAIASSKAPRTESPRSVLVAPSELILAQPPSPTGVDLMQQGATPQRSAAYRPLDSTAWRILFGGAVLAMSAALTGAQWQSHAPPQPQEAMVPARDTEPLAKATSIEPSPTPMREVSATIDPAAAPLVEASPASAKVMPDAAPRSATCSEALLALALCREPM